MKLQPLRHTKTRRLDHLPTVEEVDVEGTAFDCSYEVIWEPYNALARLHRERMNVGFTEVGSRALGTGEPIHIISVPFPFQEGHVLTTAFFFHRLMRN